MLKIIMQAGIFVAVIISVLFDFCSRKYPNNMYIFMIVLGIIYAFYCNHISASLFFFFIVTVCGIFIFKPWFHIRSGDLKFFSVLFFYFDPSDAEEFSLFLKIFILGMLLFGSIILILHYKDGKKLLNHIKGESSAVCYILLGQKQMAEGALAYVQANSSDSKNNDISEKSSNNTIPFVSELGTLFIIFFILLVF